MYRLFVPTLIVASVTIGLSGHALASESNGTPPATARFTEGEAALRAGDREKAVALYREAIQIDPDFVQAHQRFIEATRSAATGKDPEAAARDLQALYQGWAAREPKRAVYRWALGFLSKDTAKAEADYREALRLDPTFARAHFSLAENADLRGDSAGQIDHLSKAVEKNPGDPRYLVRYAYALRDSDPKRFRELSLNVVEKFPTSQAAAEALYRLGSQSSGATRLDFFNRLRAGYPPDQFGYSSLAMDTLFHDLSDPGAGLSLAREMVRYLPKSKTWARTAAYQESLVEAERLLAANQHAGALAVLEKTEVPSLANPSTLLLMKARAADGAGQTSKAYDLLADAVAREPEERLQSALATYATRLNKTSDQVDADLWRIREAGAKPATAFELTAYADGKPVKLSDYRGRVVLLNFWFPG